ncbi:DUF4837 domain-containing protein [Nonlabens sp. MB-3u-79]|jgi:hypothetical protein|uniref:DUF4837 family protein n=1 Tax=Nonlabens sp. MB-3u-79 TaxID=2058134 RepID=UPI000C31A8DA|nr:DUF4837 family protein [Nonlabens sp. MB-3u-79]AUC78663.1 DUF4837 domain-containing protein [Nonlabens sp. MB-3u-79]|tara:strand:- start:589 stop:1575 length:987 start_codon:yes stop_codon:yes gene_type:complete
MNKVYVILAICLAFISCNDQAIVVQDSAGRLNDILVVIENNDWDGALGDTIRKEFARPLDGIVREEPIFTLNHVKPTAFKGMLKKSRNYLYLKKSDSSGVSVKKDVYANPQLGIVVRGKNKKEIAQVISENADKMIALFNQGEVERKQYLMDKVALNTDRLTERFGFEIIVPRAYHFATYNGEMDNDFFWLRRNITEGTMDLMIYEVDRNRIKRSDSTVMDIVKVRDSIGAIKILTDGGPFQTEPAFSPFLNESQIDGNFAFETKGTWEVKNMFMAGPFVNYAIYNKEKDNWLIIEGYVSAPSSKQRNYLFEIESILKSVRFVDKEED